MYAGLKHTVLHFKAVQAEIIHAANCVSMLANRARAHPIRFTETYANSCTRWPRRIQVQ